MQVNTVDKIRAYLKVRDDLLALLAKAQEERQQRTPWGPDGWILHERCTMHVAVNAERIARGAVAVPIEHIERAERMARGHSTTAASLPSTAPS